jgi:SPP1 gp7 family putative phage head morphogenesis protein
MSDDNRIISSMSALLGQNKAETTPEGKPLPVIIQKLTVRPIHRRTQDIGNWRQAMRAAEATIPRRTELYDLYEEIMLDGHLTSVVEKRIMAVTNCQWMFVDAKGKEVDFMNDWIDTPDFELVVEEILNSKIWGYTMLEFDFYKEGGVGVFLIPRKHMRPELGMVAYEQTANVGINIREGIYANTVLEAGKEKNLGLLLKAAQYVIYKRGNFGDWAQFAEIFGMPLIDAVWDGYDENQRLMLLKALEEMGGGGQLVRPAGTELNFIQGGTNNPTGDLYKNLIECCNAELSKLILGQTETTESSPGSGYAQAAQHGETEDDINRSDRNFVRRILNRRLCKMFEANGIDLNGGYFKIKNDYEEKLSKSDQLNLELRLKNEGGIPIDDDHFYETYGIEKPANYDELKAELKEKAAAQQFSGGFGLNDKQEGGVFHKLRSFFFRAPTKATGADINVQLHELYNHECCSSDDSEFITLADGDIFNEDFIYDIFKGYLKDGQIHQSYYFDVAKMFKEAMMKGLGGDSSIAYKNTLRQHLEHNIYAFSAAKSMTVMSEMSKQLLDENGKLRSFAAFRNAVVPIDKEFNNHFLKTEYRSAVAMAQMADKWENLKGYDKLEYRTVKDNRVRESHAKLDGLVLDTNDKLWSTLWPPNDWGCRCNVVPAPGAIIDENKRKVAVSFLKSDAIKPYFKRNSGIEKTVFNDKHPYFTRLKSKPFGAIKDKQFFAVENYNMRPAEYLVKDKNRKPLSYETDEKTALEKFEQLKGKTKTADGNEYDLSSWNHKANHKGQRRWEYMSHVKEVLQDADEVWSTEDKGKIYKRYVKYYQGKPLVFSFPIDAPENWTFYESDLEIEKGKEVFLKLRANVRKGILIYRK